MTIDPTDAIADARDGLDRAAGAFVRAHERMEVASGKDRSGEILVRARPDGTVEDVVIGSAWMRHVAPDELGATIMDAYTDATTQVLNTWGQAVVEEADRPALRPMPDVGSSLHARLDELTDPAVVSERSEEVLTRLADYLAEVNEEIDGLTAEAESVAAAVSVGVSRGVEVSVNGMGTLVDVRVEPVKAAGTNGAGIARDVMRAYKDAVRQARTRTVDDVIAASKIGELQRLADDPRALAERFGLA